MRVEDLVEPFRDRKATLALAERLAVAVTRPTRLMEVCGTHTVAFLRAGLASLVPERLSLIAGPGCPVCVTSASDIATATLLAEQPEVIVTTFGDMLRVPAGGRSLEASRAQGAKVRVVTSPMESLDLARANPGYKVVFLAIGFETTAPSVAATVKEAAVEDVRNYLVFVAHKLIPPAMEALLESGEVAIDGYLCPGHVSAIIGAQAYQPLAEKFRVPCVVTGFEPTDLLEGMCEAAEMVASGEHGVRNQYRRVVRWEGNERARALVDEVFQVADAEWRGLGVIPRSGLMLRNEFARFDARRAFDLSDAPQAADAPGCRCGEVLRGLIAPPQCALFGSICTPESPQGACMVSSEGACRAYYRYGGMEGA